MKNGTNTLCSNLYLNTEIGLNNKMVEKKLAKAYLKFYTRPKYLLKHRHMFKVILQTVLRSFIIPKFTGSTAKGWYQNLDNKFFKIKFTIPNP